MSTLSTAVTADRIPPVQQPRPWKAATLFCMGVVFGDIGTSPLYTLNVAAKAASPSGAVAPEAVLGVVSLIFWSLIVVISIKYAILIMRADNHGEGGILALLALISPSRARESRRRAIMVVVGLVGATLLYGDGAITPAISVLSAIEGIKVYAPRTGHVVVPLTVVILLALFIIQRKGTSFVGGLFGPVMLIWFVVIALLGLMGIARTPTILAALSPLPAITYLSHAGPLAFAVIGGAFLAVTGGEAFYADMGHFGPLPIRVAWFAVALPALTLSYFGQGALLLTQPTALESPFYELAPPWAHIALVVLSTVATVIASQSIISGAYSLTHQSIQLGFLPRMAVVHTARSAIGQIYVPVVNWVLAVLTLTAVIGFGSSDALAGAFGIAVHQGINGLAPTRHLSNPPQRIDGFVARIVDHRLEAAGFDPAERYRLAQSERHIRCLHEPVAQLDSSNAGTDGCDHGPLGGCDARYLRNRDSDQQDVLVQHSVKLEVLRQRQGDPLRQAAEHDGRSGKTMRRVSLNALGELLQTLPQPQTNAVHDLLALAPGEHQKRDHESDQQRKPAAVDQLGRGGREEQQIDQEKTAIDQHDHPDAVVPLQSHEGRHQCRDRH